MSSPSDQKPLWPVASLIVLTGLNTLDYIDRALLGAVLPVLQPSLGLNDSQAGTIGTAFMLGYFMTSPIFGYLGDRMPRRWLIAAGVFVWSLGTLLSGHANGYVSLIFFRVLVGFGEASFGTLSPAWIADLFPPAKRNTAISIFYVALPVGTAIGYLYGGYVAHHYDWRTVFLVAGYPGLLLALVLFFLREPARGASDPDHGKSAVAPEKGLRSYGALLAFPRYVLVIAGYIPQAFAMGGFQFWAASFLVRVHHMELKDADDFFGKSLVVMGLLATVVGGYVATKWQQRTGTGYAWTLSLSALAAVPSAFLAFTLANLFYAKVALAASMFFLFFCNGPLNTLIIETVPATMRASAVAMSIFSIHMFGDLWSPKIVGVLSERWGDLKRAMLWCLPGVLILSAFFWCWLLVITPRRSRETVPPAST